MPTRGSNFHGAFLLLLGQIKGLLNFTLGKKWRDEILHPWFTRASNDLYRDFKTNFFWAITDLILSIILIRAWLNGHSQPELIPNCYQSASNNFDFWQSYCHLKVLIFGGPKNTIQSHSYKSDIHTNCKYFATFATICGCYT